VQFADVAVDIETGVTRVNRIVAVQDCGLIVNRLTAESQVVGNAHGQVVAPVVHRCLLIEPPAQTSLRAALGSVSWLTMARIVRGQVLSLKNQEFVLAARATGVSGLRIIFRHIVPNTLGPVIVYATLTIPQIMLTEAFLSFLGFGVQAPLASWGSLAADGVQNIAIFPWQLIFPGVTMALTLFSLNFLGDGLRDALDPQMRTV